jgi:hypothetical protein
MRLTIIPEDKTVIIDKKIYMEVDLSAINPSYHAVQWNGDKGEIEVYANGKPVENRPISSLAEFQWVIDLCATLEPLTLEK